MSFTSSNMPEISREEIEKALERLIKGVRWDENITIDEHPVPISSEATKMLFTKMVDYGLKVHRIATGLVIIKDKSEVDEREVAQAVLLEKGHEDYLPDI